MGDYYTGTYAEGFAAGFSAGYERRIKDQMGNFADDNLTQRPRSQEPRPKRKLSAWNKFVKANSKKPRFIYKSGAKKGKLNLKAMAVAFRKTPAGKKSKK